MLSHVAVANLSARYCATGANQKWAKWAEWLSIWLVHQRGTNIECGQHRGGLLHHGLIFGATGSVLDPLAFPHPSRRWRMGAPACATIATSTWPTFWCNWQCPGCIVALWRPEVRGQVWSRKHRPRKRRKSRMSVRQQKKSGAPHAHLGCPVVLEGVKSGFLVQLAVSWMPRRSFKG